VTRTLNALQVEMPHEWDVLVDVAALPVKKVARDHDFSER
jgi:hypothetical protein